MRKNSEMNESGKDIGLTIYHEYQPIVEMRTGSIFGYEALIRNNLGYKPLDLFKTARNIRILYKLDSKSIKKAIIEMLDLFKCHIFINIFPSTALDSRFQHFLKELQTIEKLVPSKIIFEFNEDYSEKNLWTLPELKQSIRSIRNCGFKIALDDVGSEASSIVNIIEYNPDFIKLDRFFSQSLATSKDKQQLVKLFTQYKSDTTKLILEGIETESDFLTAKELGVELVQGYYISSPKPPLRLKVNEGASV